MKLIIKTIIYFLFLFYSNELFSLEINNVRYGSNAEVKRIVFDISNDITFKNKVSKNKIEIKFDKNLSLKKTFTKNNDLKEINFDTASNSIILVFNRDIHSPNIYFLKKKNNEFARVVIDYKNKVKKRKIVVVDPGHGGRDSGAVGITKIFEKNITLKVALLLKKEFSKYDEFHVILTREKDVYLKLRERTKIAKNSNADIFISLHADFNKSRRTRGISLYTLSEKASDKEAEDLARRENRSDFLGNIDLSAESSEVTNILIDLTKRETLNQSSHLVNFLIKDIKNEMNLLKRAHRFAGFAVLKSLDIPSVLIEMGYLSNREDSKLLVSSSYQKKITSNIVKAVKNYFDWIEKNN
ncbi:MAG: N-acetylmuramoyl-L-alanine amidase [Pelagibacteraceae bacterium TMED124]|nr:hypothetical protein [Rickettsiales bacterium]RPG16669.1 MAG: N-acetylmuramoyl-L-alanine amidase [Pelagibacteraceae bacterium TMED124]